MTLPGRLYTSANFRTHDSTPETLMPEGNKSRVSGGGAESNYTEQRGLTVLLAA